MAKSEGIALYNVDEAYVDYLSPHVPHLFRNANSGQRHPRKDIGVVLRVGSFEYFAPLSSFKEKHRRMKDGLDFIKLRDYAVINLKVKRDPPLICGERKEGPSPN